MARKSKNPAKPTVPAEKYEALEQDFNELTARTMMLKRDLLMQHFRQLFPPAVAVA